MKNELISADGEKKCGKLSVSILSNLPNKYSIVLSWKYSSCNRSFVATWRNLWGYNIDFIIF